MRTRSRVSQEPSPFSLPLFPRLCWPRRPARALPAPCAACPSTNAVKLSLEQNLGIQIDRLTQIQDISVASPHGVDSNLTSACSTPHKTSRRPARCRGKRRSRTPNFHTGRVAQTLRPRQLHIPMTARARHQQPVQEFRSALSSNVAFNITQPL